MEKTNPSGHEIKDLGACQPSAVTASPVLRTEPASSLGPDGRVPHGAAHTPGPWHFRLEAVRTVIFHKAEIGEKAIAVGAGSYPDHIANARLIAAAPCLYEALLTLWRAVENYAPDLPGVDEAQAALAKATGQ